MLNNVLMMIPYVLKFTPEAENHQKKNHKHWRNTRTGKHSDWVNCLDDMVGCLLFCLRKCMEWKSEGEVVYKVSHLSRLVFKWAALMDIPDKSELNKKRVSWRKKKRKKRCWSFGVRHKRVICIMKIYLKVWKNRWDILSIIGVGRNG